MIRMVMLIFLILVTPTFGEELISYQSDFPVPRDQLSMISGLHYRSDNISLSRFKLERWFH